MDAAIIIVMGRHNRPAAVCASVCSVCVCCVCEGDLCLFPLVTFYLMNKYKYEINITAVRRENLQNVNLTGSVS